MPVPAPAVPLAERCCKARYGGRCVLCPAPVTVGVYIARLPGLGWAHAACVVAAAARRGGLQETPAAR